MKERPLCLLVISSLHREATGLEGTGRGGRSDSCDVLGQEDSNLFVLSAGARRASVDVLARPRAREPGPFAAKAQCTGPKAKRGGESLLWRLADGT